MPFITSERRIRIGADTLAENELQPGDRCYIFYKEMVEKWKASPRWTTAHNILRDMLYSGPDTPDDHAAFYLAWQVFFNLHVIPYELQKREENGDI